jgi:hypothetical protein
MSCINNSRDGEFRNHALKLKIIYIRDKFNPMNITVNKVAKLKLVELAEHNYHVFLTVKTNGKRNVFILDTGRFRLSSGFELLHQKFGCKT